MGRGEELVLSRSGLYYYENLSLVCRFKITYCDSRETWNKKWLEIVFAYMKNKKKLLEKLSKKKRFQIYGKK